MISLPESRVQHIFRRKRGHLEDTPGNRQLLIDIASVARNYVGTDVHGNQWYAQSQEDGSQVWVQIRDEKILNGGVNVPPNRWNETTGFSAPKRR